MEAEMTVGPQWNERHFRRRAILCAILLASLAVTAMSGMPLFDHHRHRRRIHSDSDFLLDRRLKGGHTRKSSFELLETVPHDASAFTQGLVVIAQGDNITLYEGTGLYGRSQLRIVDLPTGQVLQRYSLPSNYFGEGIAYYTTSEGDGRIVQLTWKERTAFIYDSETLELLSEFQFSTKKNEGWGITHRRNASSFVVSDGSSSLHMWDETTFSETSRVRVISKWFGLSMPMHNLNELEWDPFTDTILANVWRKNYLLRIDPDTGVVTNQYNLKSLFPPNERPGGADVMNGIALVPNTADEVWVTGKLWPYMFRIRLID
jgi:glutamine cyclotransferase